MEQLEATAGLVKKPSFLATGWILSQFDRRKAVAGNAYRRLRMGMEEPSPWEDLKGQRILSDEKFVQKLKSALNDKVEVKEIAKSNRFSFRPSLPELLNQAKMEGKNHRDELIRKAHLDYGYTLSEIGKYRIALRRDQ